MDIGPKGGSPILKQQLGIKGDEHDAELLRDTRQAQSEIELLTGHRFEGERLALQVGSGGLPFVPTLKVFRPPRWKCPPRSGRSPIRSSLSSRMFSKNRAYPESQRHTPWPRPMR